MYYMPYGVVNKLLEDGWKIKPNKVNGQSSLHLPNEDWFISDNGFVSGYNWRFLNRRGGPECIYFGENVQPIQIVITEKEITFGSKTFHHKRKESFDLVLKMFRYYRVKFAIEDKRPEALREQARAMRERADRALEESARFQERAENLQTRARKLEEELKTDKRMPGG